MTPNLKKTKIWLYVYQMNASKRGNVKIAVEYIIDLLLTPNDP